VTGRSDWDREARGSAAGPPSRQNGDTDQAIGSGKSSPAEKAGGPVEQLGGGDTASTGADPSATGGAEAELEAALRTAEENWERYLRAEADLDNFRKRAARLREEALERQRRDLLVRFLDVLDNLERAMAHSEADPEAVAAGVESMYRELSRMLAQEGIETISAMDAPFDPNLHDAVSAVPVPGAEDERVVAVERNGYTLNGDLLRPARVVVGMPGPARGSQKERGEA